MRAIIVTGLLAFAVHTYPQFETTEDLTIYYTGSWDSDFGELSFSAIGYNSIIGSYAYGSGFGTVSGSIIGTTEERMTAYGECMVAMIGRWFENRGGDEHAGEVVLVTCLFEVCPDETLWGCFSGQWNDESTGEGGDWTGCWY